MRSIVIKLALCVAAVVWLGGCTHWVVIRSNPSGARAKVDGVDYGTTPFFFEETSGWSTVHRLELEKEGYEPFKTTLEQDNLQWRCACPSVCLCPFTLGLSLTGCLFSYALADEYSFVLTPVDDSGRPLPAPPEEPERPSEDGGPPADLPKKPDEPKPDERPIVPF